MTNGIAPAAYARNRHCLSRDLREVEMNFCYSGLSHGQDRGILSFLACVDRSLNSFTPQSVAKLRQTPFSFLGEDVWVLIMFGGKGFDCFSGSGLQSPGKSVPLRNTHGFGGAWVA